MTGWLIKNKEKLDVLLSIASYKSIFVFNEWRTTAGVTVKVLNKKHNKRLMFSNCSLV